MSQPTSRTVLVRSYLRRHPQTPTQTVRKAIRSLERNGAAENLRHACHIELSNEDSKVKEHPALGFKPGACTIVNIEPQDFADEIAAEATLFHETEHARDIAEMGLDGVSKEHEIRAHEATKAYLGRRLAREPDVERKRKIRRQIAEEERSIRVLRGRKG